MSKDQIIKRNNDLWILRLSVGFETNLENNKNAKNLRYNTLTQRLKTTYREIKFNNLSLGGVLQVSGHLLRFFVRLRISQSPLKLCVVKNIKCLYTNNLLLILFKG